MAGIELHVPDFAPVRDFYSRLGFRTVWEQPPEGHKGYVVMECGKNVLRFWCGNEEVYSHSYFRTFPPNTALGKGVEIVMEIENIDALYDTFKNSTHLLEALREKPWGLRDFRLKDPFGYYLRITTPHDIKSGTKYLIP